jgi:macrolide phosphotransferase
MTSELDATFIDLAMSHGLAVEPASLRVEEAGLDYRVAFCRATDGVDWVLRMPRRPDVSAKVPEERRILELVRDELPVAVPDWRICSDTLIAYPLLPGRPGLTLDPVTQTPIWHFEPTSPQYARAIGEFIAALHRISPERARDAGLVVQSMDEVREEWNSHLKRVLAQFDVNATLAQRWRRWLDDEDYWRDRATFTHGELYPAHVLIDDQCNIQGVLDWTTAKVGDPAADFVFQYMMGLEVFEQTVAAYEAAGGAKHPMFAERCARLTSASALNYALFALTSGEPEHLEAARTQLQPD